jgi:hypothetical protein
MQPLDFITFNTDELELQGDKENVRVWHTQAGDGAGLYYFALAPNIQADLEFEDEVRRFYRPTIKDSSLGMIQVDTITVDGVPAIKTIFKTPQQPTGMTYIGSITIPFRDFSYVVKIQCPERGTTGIREAIILNRESIDSSDIESFFDKWAQDPYDAFIKSPLMRNRAEAEEYDAQFPDHPLSRARSFLNQVQQTLQVAEQIKTKPSFKYVKPSPSGKSWWKFW